MFTDGMNLFLSYWIGRAMHLFFFFKPDYQTAVSLVSLERTIRTKVAQLPCIHGHKLLFLRQKDLDKNNSVNFNKQLHPYVR